MKYFMLLLFFTTTVIADTVSMQEFDKLTASDGVNFDYFGQSVAISGDTIVVGADVADNRSGAAYIYERNSSSGLFQQVAKLKASDAAERDYFGYSVGISGDTVVVGAYYDDDAGDQSGSAYIYVKPYDGWINATQNAKLTASDAATTNYFGGSVAISGDTVIVGADQSDVSGIPSGAAYLYEKPSNGWINATQNAKLTPSDPAMWDRFGGSVAISGDTVVVGSRGDDDAGDYSGSAYLYEKPLGGWIDVNQSAKLTASDGARTDNFGQSVSISADTVVVGTNNEARSAYLFTKPHDGWVDANQSAILTASDTVAEDYFAYSVAISGNTVVVGANRDDDLGKDSGSAYLYEKPLGGWVDANQSIKLLASDGTEIDYFAKSVAINGDTIVVGSYLNNNTDPEVSGPGSAYVFKIETSTVVNPSIIHPSIITYLLD